MGRADDAWEQIWSRSLAGSRLRRFIRERGPATPDSHLAIDRFDVPPSLAMWLRDDVDGTRSWPCVFRQAFEDYLDELRDEDWEIVQIEVTGAREDEFGDPIADRVDVFSFDSGSLIETYEEDHLFDFVTDYEAFGWHDVALDPPDKSC